MVTYILICQLFTIPNIVRTISEYPYPNTNIPCNMELGFLPLLVHSILHPPQDDHDARHSTGLSHWSISAPPDSAHIPSSHAPRLLHSGSEDLEASLQSVQVHQEEWSIRGSLVKAFSTFLVLSYVKILNVSSDLLTPVWAFTVHGNALNRSFLYSDGEIVYFGEEHLPFAILASTMLLIFNIIPMVLLLLYPCCCFQKCLNKCCCKMHVLHMIMEDNFQGCYQHQPKDSRYFAGLYHSSAT